MEFCEYNICKNKISIIGECKYCKKKYCNNHRYIESHKCENYNKCVDNKKEKLNKELKVEKEKKFNLI